LSRRREGGDARSAAVLNCGIQNTREEHCIRNGGQWWCAPRKGGVGRVSDRVMSLDWVDAVLTKHNIKI
jgi:hypothetical protein